MVIQRYEVTFLKVDSTFLCPLGLVHLAVKSSTTPINPYPFNSITKDCNFVLDLGFSAPSVSLCKKLKKKQFVNNIYLMRVILMAKVL